MDPQSPIVPSPRRSLRLANNNTSAAGSPIEDDYNHDQTGSIRKFKSDSNNCSLYAPVGNTPLTSMPNSLVFNLRKRLEEQLSAKAEQKFPVVNDVRTSPGLANLRGTPGE